MKIALETLGLEGSFGSLPGLIIASIGFIGSADNQTIAINLHKGLDVNRYINAEESIQRLVRLKRQVSAPAGVEGANGVGFVLGKESIQQELEILKEMEKSQQYSLYGLKTRLAAYAAVAGSSVVVWPGSWRDALVMTFLGFLFVGVFSEFSFIKRSTGPLLEFFAAIGIAFVTQCLVTIPGQVFCYWTISLGSAIWLLPGLSITTSTMELSNGNIISGSVNFFYAVVTALLLGFGLNIGQSFVFWRPLDPNLACHRGFSDWWEILLFPVFIGSSLVLLNAPWRQWSGMFLSSLIGWIMYRAVSNMFIEASAVVVAAGSVSLFAHVWHRLTRCHVVPQIMCGIFMLLPGSMGVRGGFAIISENYSGALSLGFSMFQTAISITVGIFAASPIVEMLKLRRSLRKQMSMGNKDTF
jgi:uncharacterized membrane protein YjjB (DUF3815 family)